MVRSEVPALIVGAGPVGVMSALLLAQQGVAALVIDRRVALLRAPAAHVVNARTFEICRAAGIDGQALAAASNDPKDSGEVLFMTRLAGDELGRLPFERQGEECLRYTPTPLRNLSQHKFESILLAALGAASRATLSLESEWEGAVQDRSGVTSRVRDLATGEVREIRSAYLLAADGAGSRVRKSLGIEMEGPAKLQSFVMVHFKANLRSLVAARPGALYWILDPEAGGTFVAHDIDREWVYMHAFDSDKETPADYPHERCRELVVRALGTDHQAFEIATVSPWTMSAQVAARFRAGRVFLVGDAAHRFPPTGGLGLNSGVQDAHGLAWKLAAVLAGWAPPSLLDTYEQERLPVARTNAAQSLRNASKLLLISQALGTLANPTTQQMRDTLAEPAGRRRVAAAIAEQAEHFDMLGLQIGFCYADGALVPDDVPAATPANPVRDYTPTTRPGARLPHAWVGRDGRTGERLSTLDLLDPCAFTLLTAEESEGFRVAAAAITDVPLVHVETSAAGLVAPGGALLVRPDQHVAWRCEHCPKDPVQALRSALARTLGR